MLSSILLTIFCAFLSSTGAATVADWNSLNKTLKGQLKGATPLASPCFSQVNGITVASQADKCAGIQAQYTNPRFRVDQFAAYEETQSEDCATAIGQQCLLDSSDPSSIKAYTNVSCNQGSVPSYYIQVKSAEEVKTAFAFAARTKTAISIKNSGHDYNGRSSGAGSLSLWTRKLQELKYEPSFVPQQCGRQAGIAAITTGAGINFDQVYTFAHEKGVTYLGGSGPTVGASGGWVMTGGHGVLSRVYGLGVDRVLEFEVVTTDGVTQIANACQNQDLFWALRGGGGGTFGVVLSTTTRVEPKLSIAVAFIALPANTSQQVLAEWTSLAINSTIKWAADGWGGFQGSGITLLGTPLLSLAQAESSMAELARFAKRNGGSVTVELLSDFYDMYTKYYITNVQAGGSALFSHNWMIPSRAYVNAQGRKQLQDHMDWMSSVGLNPGFLATTPYVYSGKGSTKAKAYAYGPHSSTSTTQAWRSSAALLTHSVGWAYNASMSDKKKVARLLTEASDRASRLWPDGASYANEAHPWVKDWKSAFWGGNYGKLKQIKEKYDSRGLLGCWHCVGSETGGTADTVGGRCLGKLI
jgi:FAD/FMN-containing dehydrogenase